MKYRFILLVLLLFQLAFAAGQNEKKLIPYYPGENMQYHFKWGLFSIGKAEICFRKNVKDCGSFIEVSAHSDGLAKVFKNIRYDFATCMNPRTGLPVTASRIVNEGDFHHENLVYYFHNLRPDSSVVYSQEKDSVVVQKNILDILTAFFTFRTNDISPKLALNTTVTHTTFFIDVVWDLKIRYGGRETVNTIFGELDCYKFYPVTQVGTYFDSPNDMIMWVTADSRKIPVRFYIDLKVGSITADLIQYTPPKF